MIHPKTPIIIGVGQITEKDKPLEVASSPLALIEQATALAIEDAGLSRQAITHLSSLVVVKSFREPMRNTPETFDHYQ